MNVPWIALHVALSDKSRKIRSTRIRSSGGHHCMAILAGVFPSLVENAR